MPNAIQLIVGLGNPGKEYAQTRHNAGAWLVELLVKQLHLTLRPEKKFAGALASTSINNENCRLLIPSTYMNLSGQAVNAVANFYHVPATTILVVHDELDLPPGDVRLKQGGGDGGHNGLRDIYAQLHTKDFWRLRIGIGHPGHRDKVHDYVLNKPSRSDEQKIMDAIDTALGVLPRFIAGETQQAIQQLHTKSV